MSGAQAARDTLDAHAGAFERHFASQGYGQLDPEPCVPTSDTSVLFTNSAVVPFKPYLLGMLALTNPGAYVRQPCVRVHNLDLPASDTDCGEFVLQFEMIGALAAREQQERFAQHIGAYLRRVAGFAPEQLLFKVATEDEDLRSMWDSLSDEGPELCDTEVTGYYRWGFGDERLSGRGATFAVEQRSGSYRDLGNLIAFERDGTTVAYGFGLGTETLQACVERARWVIDVSPAGAVRELPGPAEARVADLVGLVVRLEREGIRPASRGHGGVLRKAARQLRAAAEQLSIPADELEAWINELASVEAPSLRDPGSSVRADDTTRGSARVHDLSLFISETVPPESVLDAATTALLELDPQARVVIADIFSGPPVPRGSRSVTLRVSVQSRMAPSSAERAAALETVEGLADALATSLGATMREK